MKGRLLVVGAGLAGSMVARRAQVAGWQPVVFDSGESFSASRASTNLTRPGWVSKYPTGAAGLAALRAHWPLEEIPFNNGATPALHLPPEKVLWPSPIREKVLAVRDGELETDIGGTYRGQAVVVAAGVWSKDLVPSLYYMKVLVGHTLIFPGPWANPLLYDWAPYRQVKIFQDRLLSRTLFSDSLAIVGKNYRLDKHLPPTLRRAQEAGLPVDLDYEVRVGYRPVVAGFEVYCRRESSGLWVLTGGGKMGMTLYAAAAERIVKELCD